MDEKNIVFGWLKYSLGFDDKSYSSDEEELASHLRCLATENPSQAWRITKIIIDQKPNDDQIEFLAASVVEDILVALSADWRDFFSEEDRQYMEILFPYVWFDSVDPDFLKWVNEFLGRSDEIRDESVAARRFK